MSGYSDVESTHPLLDLTPTTAIPFASTGHEEVDAGIEPGKWRNEIWDCFRNCYPSCCFAVFLPILLIGAIAERLGGAGEERIAFFTFRYLNMPSLGPLNGFGPFFSIVSFYLIVFFIGTKLFGQFFTFLVLDLVLLAITIYFRRLIRERSL